MLSEKSIKCVDACRFCWMCRHVCPVALATGREVDTPRAKALLISLDEKGQDLRRELAAEMYNCALCDACATSCETGYEPSAFVRELRSRLAAEGLTPPGPQTAINRLLSAGTMSGIPAADTLSAFTPELEKLPEKAEILLYIGETAALRNAAGVRALLSLMNKAGVNYTVFRANLSSGAAEYDLLGPVEEVKSVCAACRDALDALGAMRIVVMDPSDAAMFKQRFPAWGLELKAPVVTATSFISELVEAGKIKLSPLDARVAYHDPCRLARDLEETEPARKLLGALGCRIMEMAQSRKLTKCCGGEVISVHSPDLAAKMADSRMRDAERVGAEILVCACPGCTANMSAAAGLPVKDIFVLLDEHST